MEKISILDKIDAITKIGEERIKAGGIQPSPKSVKIEITARCNLRCKFCAVRTRKKQPKEDMPFEFFQRITEDMKKAGVEEIGLFYLGESFMAPELLVKCTEWCKKELGFDWVFLTSNAVNARAEYVDPLMAAGLDSLKWSVNHWGYDSFHEITGGSYKQFDDALTNIAEAWEVREYDHYKTILSASSILYANDPDLVANTRRFLTQYVTAFVDRHYWLPLYQMSMYAEDIVKTLGYLPTAGNMGRLDEKSMKPTRPPLPCWSAFTEGHVRVDGGLSACCFGSDARFDMGILDGKNFMESWNSPKFQKLREAQLGTMTKGQDALKGTPCRVCVAYSAEDTPRDEFPMETPEWWDKQMDKMMVQGGHP